MTEEFTNVGSRLLFRMRELGLKQLHICQETGLSTTAVSNYCTGKRLPDTLSLYKLSSILDVSMEWILTGENRVKEDFESVDSLKSKLLEKKKSLKCDGSPLTDEEADLVAMYRLLPGHQQEDAFDLIYFKYKKHVEMKKDSIYWTYKEDEKSGTADNGDQSGTA